MNHLERFIIQTLQVNEMACVSHFGTFVRSRMPAYYDALLNSFVPPYYSVIFTQDFQEGDDGRSFVHFFMKEEDCSYDTAVQEIDKIVEKIKNEIECNGEYFLEDIGFLYKDERQRLCLRTEGQVKFESEIYGLKSISISNIRKCSDMDFLRKNKESLSHKKFSIGHQNFNSVGRKIMQHAVAIVATVILFMSIFGSQINITPKCNSNVKEAAIVNGFIWGNKTAQDLAPLPLAKGKETPEKERIVGSQERDISKGGKTNEDYYTIVLASAIAHNNALNYVHILKKEGLNAVILESSSMRRVVYSSFPSQDEAQKVLKKLRMENPHFEDAWVYKVKH